MQWKNELKVERWKATIILLVIASLFLVSQSDSLFPAEQNQPTELEEVEEQVQEQVEAKTVPPEEPAQPEPESQQAEQKKLTFRIDFKYPNGTNYGDNTPDTADDMVLLPYNFTERRRAAYLNLFPNNYTNDPEPFLKVPDELVKSIDNRVKTINSSNPEAILEVANIVQEEVIAFAPRYEQLFNECYSCIPRSYYINAMLGKEFGDLGLDAQSGIHHSIPVSYHGTGHLDVWLYDKNKHQLYIVYTISNGIHPDGIHKWEETYYQQGIFVSSLEYEKMKSLVGAGKAKQMLLFTLLSALDIETNCIGMFVTMTGSDAQHWSSQFITNGLDEELFEIAWKIHSIGESPNFQQYSLFEGRLLAWPLSGEKGIVILEKDSYLVTEKDYWFEIAFDGNIAEIEAAKRRGEV